MIFGRKLRKKCNDGVTGESAIADHWRNHYDKLLNSCTNMDDKQAVCKRFNDFVLLLECM